jgi:hypothetical protein
LFDLRFGGGAGELCRRADVRSDAQENFLDAHADSTPEKENDQRDKKEIANSNFITHRLGEKKESVACAGRIAIVRRERITAPQEEIFPNAGSIRICSGSNVADADWFAASEEKTFTNT